MEALHVASLSWTKKRASCQYGQNFYSRWSRRPHDHVSKIEVVTGQQATGPYQIVPILMKAPHVIRDQHTMVTEYCRKLLEAGLQPPQLQQCTSTIVTCLYICMVQYGMALFICKRSASSLSLVACFENCTFCTNMDRISWFVCLIWLKPQMVILLRNSCQ